MKNKAQRLDITFPPEMIKQIDYLINKGSYASRSEVLRNAFRKLYLEHLREQSAKILPKEYDSVTAVRKLKKERWFRALLKSKGNAEDAKNSY